MKTKRTKNVREKFEVVGTISVDAGIVQVGDPCYGNRDEFANHDDWTKYLEETGIMDMKDAIAIPGHPLDERGEGMLAKAVVVSSGFGDGMYPVEIKKCSKTGAVKELRIRFF